MMRAPDFQRRLLDSARQTRAMRWVMAIMLFLTVLAAALGLGAWAVAGSLGQQLEGKLTVQIIEADTHARTTATKAAIDAVHAVPEVAAVHEVDRTTLLAMLRPWLGDQGADPDLPVPALIDVELRTPGEATVDAITRAVHARVPSARIDRYEAWMSPVARFTRLMIGFAALLVAVMAVATATVVVLAARAGLDAHRDTIEVLHMLGSTDPQVARLFQRRIARDTLTGGAGGAAAAIVVVAFLGAQIAGLNADLVGGFAFGAADWIALALLPLAFALLAAGAARIAVLGRLRRFL